MENLGQEGDVVTVKDGYARNYLLPQKIALMGSPENLKRVDKIKEKRKKQREKELAEAKKLRQALENVSLTITAEAKEDDYTYGSIGEGQLLKALSEEGVNLNKGQIKIESPIKKLGAYTFSVALHPELEEGQLRVWVVKK